MPTYGSWVTPSTYSFAFDLHDTDTGVPDSYSTTSETLFEPAATPSDARAFAEVLTVAHEFTGISTDPVNDHWDEILNTVDGPGVAVGTGLEIGPSGEAGWVSAGRGAATNTTWGLAQMTMSFAVYLPDRPPTSLPSGAIGWEWEPSPGHVADAQWVLSFVDYNGPFHIYKRAPADMAGVSPTFIRDANTRTLGGAWRMDPGVSYWLPQTTLNTFTPDATIPLADPDATTVNIPVSPADFNQAELAIAWVSDQQSSGAQPPFAGSPSVYAQINGGLALHERVLSGTYQPRRYRFIFAGGGTPTPFEGWAAVETATTVTEAWG